MELVAFLGQDKENWGQVQALINRTEAEKIILIKDKQAPEFPANNKTKVIKINTIQPIQDLTNELKESLKQELSKEFEVSLSLASGNGKEHMALLSALINIPVGVKLVAYTKEGVKYLT